MSVALAVLALVVGVGDAPDFFVNFLLCKNTATVIDERGGITTMDGKPPQMMCSKNGRAARCVLRVDDETKTLDFKIEMDSPPTLVLNRNDGADHVIVDSTKHVVVYASRLMSEGDPPIYGSKLCKGIYMTAFEFEMLKKAK